MRYNNVLAKMRAGEKAYGCTFVFPSPELVDLAGMAGFDFVFLDGEHGSFTTESIETMCRAAEAAGLTPVARVPETSAPAILRYLDRGVQGIMGPHICTPDDARRLADACRFAPRGKRSFGSGRGTEYGVPDPRADSMSEIDGETLVIALLEDIEVLDHLPDILAVDGIDLYHFGPNDLAQSMGLPGLPDDPKVTATIVQGTEQIHGAGKHMMADFMDTAQVTHLFLTAALEHLARRATG